MSQDVGKVIALRDKNGNLFVIPASKLEDARILTSSQADLEDAINNAMTYDDFEFVGTVDISTSLRRRAYARPNVSVVLGNDLPTS